MVVIFVNAFFKECERLPIAGELTRSCSKAMWVTAGSNANLLWPVDFDWVQRSVGCGPGRDCHAGAGEGSIRDALITSHQYIVKAVMV